MTGVYAPAGYVLVSIGAAIVGGAAIDPIAAAIGIVSMGAGLALIGLPRVIARQ